MIKKIFISLVFMPFGILAQAQEVTLRGTVADPLNNNQPVGYADIVLLKGDSIIAGTETADDGTFVISNVKAGMYLLKASFTGYTDATKRINIKGATPDVNVGTIALKANVEDLQTVEIVTQADQVKFEVDKKVFSVDQNIVAAGGSANDALQNIPSVQVDNDGNVSLRNNSNVEIWINGKPAGLTEDNRGQILDQMPAGTIQSIEIISNPSAKYSSEGSAGIINLVMKKDRKAGYFGNVNFGLTYPLQSKLGEIAGGNINFNVGKWEGYFNLGIRNMYNASESFSDRDYLSKSGDVDSTLNQKGKTEMNMFGLMSRLGLTYHLNNKNSVGVSGYFFNGSMSSDNLTSYLKYNNLTTLQDYSRLNNTDGDQNSGNAMLDHTFKYDDKTELHSTLAYSSSKMYGEANYLNSGINIPANLRDQYQTSNNRNQTIELKSDFSKSITKLTKIEAGINARVQDRNSYSETENFDGLSFQPVPSLTDDYKYHEQVYAAYGTYGTKVKELSIHAGLRGEYTIVDNTGNGIENPTKDYFELFPTAFLSYSLPKQNEVQLNYTRRINRPRGRQLNAFKDVSNPTSISYGNPDLDPEFTNSIELNHLKAWDKLSFSTSLYYKYTTDVIQRVRFLDVYGVMNTTYMNATKSQSSGLEFVAKSSPTKFLNLTGTLNGYYYQLLATDFTPESAAEPVHIDGSSSLSWNFRLLANVMFSKTFTGQFTANYQSPRVVSQGENGQEYSFDLGLKKTFWDKKLSLAFTVRDIFATKRDVSDTESDDFRQHSESWRYAPNFRLTATYNFGNNGNGKKANAKKGKHNNGDLLEDDNMMEEY